MTKAGQLERVDVADNDYRCTVSNSLSSGWECKQLATVGAPGWPVHMAAHPTPGAAGCLFHTHCFLLELRCGYANADEPWKYEQSTTELNHSVIPVSSRCPTFPIIHVSP